MGLGGPEGIPTHLKHANSIMTQALPLPPLEVLQKKFIYNPETGELTHRENTRRLRAGDPAGYTNGRGWLRVKVGDTHYRVHRIVWKMYHGTDPAPGLTIDHINRDRADNRIDNLRLVTQKENIANSAPVLFKKPPKPKKTPEELAEIRSNNGRRRAEKNKKPIILVAPDGSERWYPSLIEAAQDVGIHQAGISRVVTGRSSQTRGYTARYA